MKKMKKFLLLTAMFWLIISLSNCKKDTATTKIPAPSWQISDVAKYPATMTAVVQLPDYLKNSLHSNDEMGVFINEECRGTGALIKLDSTSAFFIMIHGTNSENGKILFKYYSFNKSAMYTSKDTLNFVVDENYGTVDNPKSLQLNVLK